MASRFQQSKQSAETNVDNAQTRKSEWLDKCQAVGCCLKPSASIGGYQLCTYHHMQEQGEQFSNWQSISDSINKNYHLITKTFSLYLKGIDFWYKPECVNSLRGWDFCPFLEDEQINQYLAKLERKVRETVYEDAAQMQVHGNIRGSHIEKDITPKKKPKGMKSIVEIAESLEAMRNENN